MNNPVYRHFFDWAEFLFPSEWLRAALVMAFFSTLVVIGLFTYLNHYTKKEYFRFWTAAWVFYALFLLAAIGLEERPDRPLLVMVRRTCIGIGALYMFFGALQFTHRPRPVGELYLGMVLMAVWSYVAAYHVREHLWVTMPVFALLALASVYTGVLYGRYRNKYRSAALLASGLWGWGLYLLAFPFTGWSGTTETLGYVTSAVLAFFIAMAMMVQVLEEARERADALVSDIHKTTEHSRKLEQEIGLTEERYRALLDTTSDATFLVDLETVQIVEANQAAYFLAGAPPTGLLNRSFLDICPHLRLDGKSLLQDIKAFDNHFKSNTDIGIQRLDGSLIICAGESRLVQCHGRHTMQISLHEVTERGKIERQMRQVEKLSALGQLIAGVAHELNNPLAVIMGYTQLLRKRADVETRIKTELHTIAHESERAAKIVRNLLTFARPRDPEMVPVDVNQLISNVLTTRTNDFQAGNIIVEKHLAPRLPRTKADPSQLEQVLANLIVNAIQAQQHQERPGHIDITTREHGAFIQITVADAGPGIPPEVLSKIFEPFFTTKAPGQGTGLGLSITHTIIEEHHGKIWVKSEPGKGTKFFVELPIIPCLDEECQPDAPAAASEVLDDLPAGQFRLLIIDDEPGIVEVLREVFAQRGCLVDTATNGHGGLRHIAENHYDVILSDLRMPDMDGEAFYRAVREQDPVLAGRIIFLTGDTVSSNARTFLDWTGNRWFSKPFNVHDLERTVYNYLQHDASLLALEVN